MKMKTRVQNAMSVLLLLVVGVVPALQAQTWVSTATQGLILNGATDLGPQPGSTSLSVIVVLAIQNQSALQQYVLNITNPNNSLYGQSLTPAQFVSAYGPSTSQVETVTAYLAAEGF